MQLWDDVTVLHAMQLFPQLCDDAANFPAVQLWMTYLCSMLCSCPHSCGMTYKCSMLCSCVMKYL